MNDFSESCLVSSRTIKYHLIKMFTPGVIPQKNEISSPSANPRKTKKHMLVRSCDIYDQIVCRE